MYSSLTLGLMQEHVCVVILNPSSQFSDACLYKVGVGSTSTSINVDKTATKPFHSKKYEYKHC